MPKLAPYKILSSINLFQAILGGPLQPFHLVQLGPSDVTVICALEHYVQPTVHLKCNHASQDMTLMIMSLQVMLAVGLGCKKFFQ